MFHRKNRQIVRAEYRFLRSCLSDDVGGSFELAIDITCSTIQIAKYYMSNIDFSGITHCSSCRRALSHRRPRHHDAGMGFPMIPHLLLPLGTSIIVLLSSSLDGVGYLCRPPFAVIVLIQKNHGDQKEEISTAPPSLAQTIRRPGHGPRRHRRC